MSVYDYIGRCDRDDYHIFVRGVVVAKDMSENEEYEDWCIEVSEKLEENYGIRVEEPAYGYDIIKKVIDEVFKDSQRGDVVLRDNCIEKDVMYIDWAGAVDCNPVDIILQILIDLGVVEFARIDFSSDMFGTYPTVADFGIISVRYEYDDGYDTNYRMIDISKLA